LERALVFENGFESFQISGNPTRARVGDAGGVRAIAGAASGTDRGGRPVKLLYTVTDLGKEKIVARYIGTADAVAMNRSLLEGSLRSLEARSLLTAEVTRDIPSDFTPATGAALAIPAGWLTEPGQPWPCAPGLPPAATASAFAPPGDFTIVFRAAWHPGLATELRTAWQVCPLQAATFAGPSYGTFLNAWGIRYYLFGVFVSTAGGVWQIEMIAPFDKARFVVPAFMEWLKQFPAP
jgi:hypothetical protein